MMWTADQFLEVTPRGLGGSGNLGLGQLIAVICPFRVPLISFCIGFHRRVADRLLHFSRLVS